jgi:hypothetical protein
MDLHETFEFINKETLVEFVDLGQEENLLLDFKLVKRQSLRIAMIKRISPRQFLGSQTQVAVSLYGVLMQEKMKMA